MKGVESVIFDLDGTLAESKLPLTKEMAVALKSLADKMPIAIISGASFNQFKEQFFPNIPEDFHWNNLYLLPASGTQMFKRGANNGDWEKVYDLSFSEDEKKSIIDALESMRSKYEVHEIPEFGKQIEDRDSQITFSALGQHAPIEKKEVWDSDHKKRLEMVAYLKTIIPHFTIESGGSTSIDITKEGYDKSFGINKFAEVIKMPVEKILYVGDALYKDGNDSAAFKTGVMTHKVNGPSDTHTLIMDILKYNEERNWGHFEKFTENERVSVKLLYIKPNCGLHLQTHAKREEMLKIVTGNPIVTLGEKNIEAKVGEEFMVPIGVKHKITSRDLETIVLEVSRGEFDENDIIHYENN